MSNMCTKTMQYDVVVIGGGPAGFGAAVAAGRAGLKTCLLEKNNKIGGILAICPFMPIGGAYIGKQMKPIGGLVEELAQNLIQQDPPAGIVRENLLKVFGAEFQYDHEALMLELYRMLDEAGVDLYTETNVYDVQMQGNKVEKIFAMERTEFVAFEGKVFIDCSGDGIAAEKAGIPYEKGDNDGNMMGVSTTFMMYGLDWDKVFPPDLEEPFRETTLKKGIAEGKLSPRLKVAYVIKGLKEGSGLFNACVITGVDGTDHQQLQEASKTTRQWAHEMADYFIKNVEGFENGYVVYTGPQAGVRETRRFEGMYYLTAEDILKHATFDDAVVCCGNPMDEVCRNDEEGIKHTSVGGQEETFYQVPFRCLVPKTVENMMFAGRNLSCDTKTLASVRSMATCMIMGQACGVAALPVVKDGIAVQAVDTKWLAEELKQQGVAGIAGTTL